MSEGGGGAVRDVAKEVEFKAGKPAIPVKLTLPATPGTRCSVGVILSHGAGGDMDSGILPRLATALASVPPGVVAVLRFTCRPPHLPTRVAACEAVLRAAAEWPETCGIRAWIAAGHSMGGRVACQVARAHSAQAGRRQEQEEQQRQNGQHGQQGQQEQQEQEQGRGQRGRQRRRAEPGGPGVQSSRGAEPGGRKRPRRGASAAGAGAEDEFSPDAHTVQLESKVNAGGRAAIGGGAGERTVAAAGAAAASAAAAVASSAALNVDGPEAGAEAEAAKGRGGTRQQQREVRGGRPTRRAGAIAGAAPQEAAAATAAAAAAATAAADGGDALPRMVACVLLSYPLHPPGKPDRLRDEPLVSLRCPLLWVRGTRDEFCTPGPFAAVQPRLASQRLQVYTVEGGDHGLALPGSRRDEQEAALAGVLSAVSAFVQEIVC